MVAKKITGEVIKVPPKMMVGILVFMAIFFGLGIYSWNKRAEKYVAANFNTVIRKTKIDVKNGFGGLNNALFYAKDSFVGESAALIGNNPVNKNLWHSHGPDIDFNRQPHEYTLSDLKLPFTIEKKAGTDTLFVIKDSITFYFKLEAEEAD